MNPNSLSFSEYYYQAQVRVRECVSCDKKKFKLVTLKNRHSIALPTSLCMNCGLVQINPIPSAAWYETFYTEYFWGMYVGRDISFDELYLQDNYGCKGSSIAEVLVTESACQDPDDYHFLDIGCGLGGLLVALQEKKPAWKLSAIEPSLSARNYVKSNTGITPDSSDFKSLPYQDGCFDLVSLVHVLEHVYEPLVLLREVRRILKKDGICYIEVPDLESPKWGSKDFLHIAHLYLFDRLTLSNLLKRAGLYEYRVIDSPAGEFWPWARGYFVRAMDIDPQPVAGCLEEKIVNKRINYLDTKLNEPRHGLLDGIRSTLGPGFPGPATISRLTRQFLKRIR